MDTTIRTIYSNSAKKELASNNLYLLGKVWGFLKYYHPEIASGKYDWDNELMDFLPRYIKITSIKERNDSLESWIHKFGEIPVCATCNDSVLAKAKLKPDFAWFTNSNFSPSLIKLLKHVRDNRIQTDQYYNKFMSADGVSFVTFQHEPGSSKTVFPNDPNGILSVFRFWNAIEYWYPYKYNLPVAWDTVLKQFIEKMLTHQDNRQYTLLIEELISSIHDGHGFYRSTVTEQIDGKYYMPFTIQVVEDKILITSILNDSLAALSNVQVGDVLTSIENTTLQDFKKEYALIVPASNEGDFLKKLSYRLTRSSHDKSQLTLERNNKILKTESHNYIPKPFPAVNLSPTYFSFGKDSSFCMIGKDIGYINVGNFNRKDSLELGVMVAKVSKLIIDNRQNQDESKGTGGGEIIGSFIMPADNQFVRFSTPEPSYPGVFRLTEPTNMGTQFKENYFKGDIVILIDENTMSVGEFLTMAYQKATKAITLGTTTAGADGNVTYLTLPGGIFTQFTGLGVYYPDGEETQRVGIKPTIEVKKTINGYRKNIDEQLNGAVDYLQKKK